MLARDRDRALPLELGGAELVIGDLQGRESLDKLVKGCDAVMHVAGAVRGNSLAEFRETNVEGTRRLLNAAEATGNSPRFLLLSSLAAREPQLSWYSRSKRDAEVLVANSTLDWMVLRPPAVYGPGDEEMQAIFDWMARGIATVPGAAAARTSLVHVDDLVDAIMACLSSEAVVGKVLELGDGKPAGYDWPELAAIAGDVYGRHVRLVRIPAPLLNAVALINLALARLTGRAAMLTPPKLRELRHADWVTDNTAITAATGWVPGIRLREGLAATREAAL